MVMAKVKQKVNKADNNIERNTKWNLGNPEKEVDKKCIWNE